MNSVDGAPRDADSADAKVFALTVGCLPGMTFLLGCPTCLARGSVSWVFPEPGRGVVLFDGYTLAHGRLACTRCHAGETVARITEVFREFAFGSEAP